jgi:hypothetical protein
MANPVRTITQLIVIADIESTSSLRQCTQLFIEVDIELPIVPQPKPPHCAPAVDSGMAVI